MREVGRWSLRLEHPEFKIIPNDLQSNVWVLVRINSSLFKLEIHITYYAPPYVLPESQNDITDFLVLLESIPARNELIITYPKDRFY